MWLFYNIYYLESYSCFKTNSCRAPQSQRSVYHENLTSLLTNHIFKHQHPAVPPPPPSPAPILELNSVICVNISTEYWNKHKWCHLPFHRAAPRTQLRHFDVFPLYFSNPCVVYSTKHRIESVLLDQNHSLSILRQYDAPSHYSSSNRQNAALEKNIWK